MDLLALIDQRGHDDPDVNVQGCLRLGAQLYQVLQRESGQADQGAIAREISPSADSSFGMSRRSLPRTWPDRLSHKVADLCWQPYVKGFVLQHNSLYNTWRFDDMSLDK
jgi:hypothetical protein